jgi:hypothetical protein
MNTDKYIISPFRHPEPGEGSKGTARLAPPLGSFARLRMTLGKGIFRFGRNLGSIHT